MLTISKALSAAQAEIYHKEEFANAQANYYSEGESIRGEWHGKLAEQWGLRGEVDQEQFARLANGQHPTTASSWCDTQCHGSIWMLAGRPSNQWSTGQAGMQRSPHPRAYL